MFTIPKLVKMAMVDIEIVSPLPDAWSLQPGIEEYLKGRSVWPGVGR
jgi:hypothetical protein